MAIAQTKQSVPRVIGSPRGKHQQRASTHLTPETTDRGQGAATPNNLFPEKARSGVEELPELVASSDTDEDADEAAEVKSVLDWSVFTDEGSANLLREFLKEHADHLPDEEDEGDVQEAQQWLTAGTPGWLFNDRDHMHTKTQWAEWRLGMSTHILKEEDQRSAPTDPALTKLEAQQAGDPDEDIDTSDSDPEGREYVAIWLDDFKMMMMCLFLQKQNSLTPYTLWALSTKE